MKFVGFDREEDAIRWVKRTIGIQAPTGFCRALSCVDDAGEFVFVVVLSNFGGANVDLHTAAVPGARWATPRAFLAIFNATFDYTFNTLGAKRVTGLVRADNAAARQFDEHIGFELEGRMRQAFPDGTDCLIYGFLKSDYEKHPLRRSK